MDRQPTAFQNWFTKLVTGDAKRPEKQPKYWATLLRDRLISDLVSTLRKHGIDHSRNPTTDEDAGFDIVANACLDAGIKGVSSDQTVKGIYYKATA